MTDGTNPVNFEDGTECPASPNKPGELQSAGPAVSLGGDDLVMRLMYELHAHVPEEQRPLSMSDLSDEQAARARKAVHAVLTEWERGRRSSALRSCRSPSLTQGRPPRFRHCGEQLAMFSAPPKPLSKPCLMNGRILRQRRTLAISWRHIFMRKAASGVPKS
jgi:hypothetical protein